VVDQGYDEIKFAAERDDLIMFCSGWSVDLDQQEYGRTRVRDTAGQSIRTNSQYIVNAIFENI